MYIAVALYLPRVRLHQGKMLRQTLFHQSAIPRLLLNTRLRPFESLSPCDIRYHI
jgi:hypothetical protein